MRRDVFQAIADPIRREIIELISTNSLTINEIAASFEISRPAISKHVKILKECGVIEISKDGRERHCQVIPKNLIPAFLWLEQYQTQWENRLDSFENHLKYLQSKNKTNE